MEPHRTPERPLVSAVLDVLQQQKNAKQAADRRYVGALQGALQGCSLTEEFVLSNAAESAEPPSADGGRYGHASHLEQRSPETSA